MFVKKIIKDHWSCNSSYEHFCILSICVATTESNSAKTLDAAPKINDRVIIEYLREQITQPNHLLQSCTAERNQPESVVTRLCTRQSYCNSDTLSQCLDNIIYNKSVVSTCRLQRNVEMKYWPLCHKWPKGPKMRGGKTGKTKLRSMIKSQEWMINHLTEGKDKESRGYQSFTVTGSNYNCIDNS